MKEIFGAFIYSIRNNLIQILFLLLLGLFYYPMAHNGKQEFILFFLLSLFLGFLMELIFWSIPSPKKTKNRIHILIFYLGYFLSIGSYVCYNFWGSPINFHIVFDLLTSIKHYYSNFYSFNVSSILLILWLISFVPIYLFYSKTFYQKLQISRKGKQFSFLFAVSIFVSSLFITNEKFKSFLMNHPYLYAMVDISDAVRISYKTKIKEKKNVNRLKKLIPKSEQNDIYLITIDALRRDYFYPYQNFEKLCPEMYQMLDSTNHHVSDSFYAISSYSSCGLPSMLAGKEVGENDVIDISIFQVMKQLGYETGAILSGNHSGFNNLKYKYGNFIDTYIDGFYDINYVPSDDRILLEGIKELNWKSKEPKFVWFHLMSVHTAGYKYLKEKPQRPVDLQSEIDKYIYEYEWGVMQASNILNSIFIRLKDEGKLETSTIIISSDHGEMLGKNNKLAHSKHLDKETIEIPLFVINPKGIDIDFGTQIDISPLILSVASENRIEEWDGYSRKSERPEKESISIHAKGKIKTGVLKKSPEEVKVIIN